MQLTVAVVALPDHRDMNGGAFDEVAEALDHGLLARAVCLSTATHAGVVA